MVSAPARRVAPCLRRVKGLTLKKDSTRGSLPPARAVRPVRSTSRVRRAFRARLASISRARVSTVVVARDASASRRVTRLSFRVERPSSIARARRVRVRTRER